MTNPDDDVVPPMSLPWLVGLHLLPGLGFGALFAVLTRLFVRHGLTGYLALLATVPLFLVPVEVGVMLLWRDGRAGCGSLSRAIAYRAESPVRDYVAWPLLILLWMVVSSLPVASVSAYIDAHFSFWLPPWISQHVLLAGVKGLSSGQRLLNLGMAVVLSGFVAPIVEEMYFRGFLLSRMGRLGLAAPAVNALLFAVYHFYFLANVPAVFVVFLPVAYLARAKANWRIGAVAHGLINLLGVLQVAQAMT